MKNRKESPAIFGVSNNQENYRQSVLELADIKVDQITKNKEVQSKINQTAIDLIDAHYNQGNREAYAIDTVNEYLENELFSQYWDKCYSIACADFKDPGTQRNWDGFISDQFENEIDPETAVKNFKNFLI